MFNNLVTFLIYLSKSWISAASFFFFYLFYGIFANFSVKIFLKFLLNIFPYFLLNVFLYYLWTFSSIILRKLSSIFQANVSLILFSNVSSIFGLKISSTFGTFCSKPSILLSIADSFLLIHLSPIQGLSSFPPDQISFFCQSIMSCMHFVWCDCKTFQKILHLLVHSSGRSKSNNLTHGVFHILCMIYDIAFLFLLPGRCTSIKSYRIYNCIMSNWKSTLLDKH